MNEKKNSFRTNLFLVAIFIVVQFLFLAHLFSYAFVILLLTMIIAVFFSEQQRLFIWLSFCFYAGIFAFIYADRLLLLFFPSISNTDALILTRFLFLLPIAMMSYVLMKFKKPVTLFSSRPQWHEKVKFPLFWLGFKEVSIQTYFFFLMACILLIPFTAGFSFYSIDAERIVKIITFSVFNGIFIEFIWRGILLSQMNHLIGETLSSVITGLSCALFYSFMGFPFFVSFLIFLFGIFFGGMAIKSRSVLLPGLLHILYSITLIVQGFIPI